MTRLSGHDIQTRASLLERLRDDRRRLAAAMLRGLRELGVDLDDAGVCPIPAVVRRTTPREGWCGRCSSGRGTREPSRPSGLFVAVEALGRMVDEASSGGSRSAGRMPARDTVIATRREGPPPSGPVAGIGPLTASLGGPQADPAVAAGWWKAAASTIQLWPRRFQGWTLTSRTPPSGPTPQPARHGHRGGADAACGTAATTSRSSEGPISSVRTT